VSLSALCGERSSSHQLHRNLLVKNLLDCESDDGFASLLEEPADFVKGVLRIVEGDEKASPQKTS